VAEERRIMTDFEQANHLDYCASLLKHYAKILRGEEQDLTNCGALSIFFINLEHALNVTILNKELGPTSHLGKWKDGKFQELGGEG
jgi:hypothetical protein